MHEQVTTGDTALIARNLPPKFRLAHGEHSAFTEEGVCAMEAVAYLAGEEHSARPQCASPVLTVFCFRLNDQWKDDERQKLLAILPRLIGTRGALERHARQALAIVDGITRDLLPMVFDARGWNDLTEQLRSHAVIADRESGQSACAMLNAVRKAVSDRRKAPPPEGASSDEIAAAYVDAALSATYDGTIAWAANAAAYAHDAADIYADDDTLAALAYDAAATCAAFSACTAAYVFRHRVVAKTLDIFGRAIAA